MIERDDGEMIHADLLSGRFRHMSVAAHLDGLRLLLGAGFVVGLALALALLGR